MDGFLIYRIFAGTVFNISGSYYKENLNESYILCKTSITSQEQYLTYRVHTIRRTLMNHTFFVKLLLHHRNSV